MDFAQQVKASADIVTVIGRHVRLRQSGSSRYIGLCPFHSERTPSFSVHSRLQIFKCFGCGKGGDVFSFLMELQSLSFFEALTALAEEQGLQVPRRAGSPQADSAANRREAVLRIHELAQELYLEKLRGPAGAQARRYLGGRGLAAPEIEEFGLGFAPRRGGLVNHLSNRGFTWGDVRDSGLVMSSREDGSKFDRFRDRLMIPIHSDMGKIIAYGGRVLRPEVQPKYMNSPETPVYRKRAVLFNLHRARVEMRRTNLAVLVEGYLDVIGVWRAGVRNAVATCGTALASAQIGLLRRHCDTVTVNFDSDRAGREAAERSVELLLREGMNVRVLELPGGLDPDEYCRKHGGAAYRERLERAPRYFRWLLDRSRHQFDLSASEGRTAAFKKLLKTVLLLPDEVQRATTVTELADHIGLEQSVALHRLHRSSNHGKRRRQAPKLPDDGLSHGERLLLVLLVESAAAREELLEEAQEAARSGLPSRGILQAVANVRSSGEAFEYAKVEGRLEEEDRDRLAKLVFDKDRPRPTLDQGRQALAAIRRAVAADCLREVQREIGEADEAGDSGRVEELLLKKLDLERELHLRPN